MATHGTVQPEFNGEWKCISGGRAAGGHRLQITSAISPLPHATEQSYAGQPGQMAAGVLERSKAHRRLRRSITREQGRALETIGHAIDYLNDCYLYEGAENDRLDFRGPSIEAVHLLIQKQRQMLESLPIVETLASRLWNRLLCRPARS